MSKVALIVAGGKGVRMNSRLPKQFLLLNRLPILMHTINLFADFEKIIVVLPESQFKYWKGLCKRNNFKTNHTVVKGGRNRFQSVKNGLAKITSKCIVAIHDGVRPLAPKALITHVISKTSKGFGVVPVLPINDSIRRVSKEKSINIDRKNLYKVQTPQCFMSSDIKRAYQQNFSTKFTDDSSVLESIGGKITTVLGDTKNIKITTEQDLKIAELFMQ